MEDIRETVAYPGPARETHVSSRGANHYGVSTERFPPYQHAPQQRYDRDRSMSSHSIYGTSDYIGQVPSLPPPSGPGKLPFVHETRAPMPVIMPVSPQYETPAFPTRIQMPTDLPPSAFETRVTRPHQYRTGSLGTFPRDEKYRHLDRIHEDGHPDTARFETEEFRAFHLYLTKSTALGRSSPRTAEVGQVDNSDDFIRALMAKLHEPLPCPDRLYHLLALCKLSNWREQECVDLVTKLRFDKFFILVWNNLTKGDEDLNDQIKYPGNYILANLLLDAAQRFTELSPKLCSQMGKNHTVSRLLDFIRREFFAVSALNEDDDELQWMSRRELLKKIFTILYNCIRNYPDNRKNFRKHRAYETLVQFLDCRFFILRAKVLFILAYIVTERENEKLNTTSLNIEFIVKILRRSLEDDKHHYSPHYNFFAVEVAEAVQKVAVNDLNKVKFVEAGVLVHLVSMVTEKYSLEERKSALKALWMLSFSEENKNRILQEKDLVDNVKFCQGVDELSRTTRAILWNLGLLTPEELATKQEEDKKAEDAPGKDAAKGEDKEGTLEVKKATTRETNGGKRPHVMISYQWDVQKQIIAVKDLLKKNGFNVWLDIESMGGSTLEAMAAAVEDAVVVIICFSEKYKDSPSCRTEAEYTYKLRKPIVPLKMQKDYDANGWLGAMLGTKLWIEMHTMDHVAKNIQALFRELANRGRYLSPQQDDPTLDAIKVADASDGDGKNNDEDDDNDDDSNSSYEFSSSPATSPGSVQTIPRETRLPYYGQSTLSPVIQSPVIPEQPRYIERIVEKPVIVERVVEVPATQLPPPAGATSIRIVMQWNEYEVRSWLNRNNFEHVQDWFVGFRGRDVVGLKRIAAEAPSYFYSKLEAEFGFKSLLGIIRFKQMLDDIK